MHMPGKFYVRGRMDIFLFWTLRKISSGPSVRSGERFMSRRTETHQRKNIVGEKVLARLSLREAEVFCLTGCGYSPRRVADKMSLSIKTIESFRERIRKKMDLPTGADLLFCSTSFMRSAARRGVEEPDDPGVRELLSATG